MDENDYYKNAKQPRRRQVEQVNLPGGMLPPQALDQEEAVLGTIMLYEQFLMDVTDILKPEMFYATNHQIIYSAIVDLYEKSQPIDVMTVTAKLRKTGQLEIIGGAYYLTELSDTKSKNSSLQFHCLIIKEKFLSRELIRISSTAINSAYTEEADILELVEKTQIEILELTNDKKSNRFTKIKESVRERIKTYTEPIVNGMTGIPTGLNNLDVITHGWQKSDLVIIAARPAMGKTAFVLQCAKKPAIDLNKPVVVFSLEMSTSQLTDRLISSEANIYLDDLLGRKLSDYNLKRIDSATEKLQNAPIIIDDTPALNIFDFRAKCRRLKAMYDIQLIIVDYLQLMHGKSDKGNREQEIGSISRTLKSVAKELNVPVLALSQLSREVEKRPGNLKRPMLSDLRESGSIEQDADMVLFLYRPEYYGISEVDGESTVGLTEIIVAKNRQGITDTAKIDFNGAFMRFKDRDQISVSPPAAAVPVQADIFASAPDISSNSSEDDELPF